MNQKQNKVDLSKNVTLWDIIKPMLIIFSISIFLTSIMLHKDIIGVLKNDVKEYKFVVYYPNENDTIIIRSCVKPYCAVGRGYNKIVDNWNGIHYITTAPVKQIK